MANDATSIASTLGSEGSDGDFDDSGSDTPVLDTGELRFLQLTLEDALEGGSSVRTPKKGDMPPSLASASVYGNPLSEEKAAAAVPPGNDGLMRYATVIPDDFCTNGKLVAGLNKRDFDLTNGTIKPRRASLPLTQSQLFKSLTKIDGPDGPRYIFHGVLNGWPSLTTFELVELEKKRSLGPLTAPDYVSNIRHSWGRYWSADKEGASGVSPAIKEPSKIYRAKFRGAPWSAIGWSPESPGFLFWYEALRAEGPRVTYGTNAVRDVGRDRCKTVHMISHRYAMKKESAKDKVTYHSIVFLEWEHGQFGTVVEGAYLNGIGGYKGRSNWYHDKDEEVTELYKVLPPELISPWLTTAAELRCFDVEAKDLDEMKDFIAKYTGPEQRFLDPHYTFSHPARLTSRSRSDIAQYLINYIGRDCSYSQLTRNCQTLAADLCSFLAGKKDVVPYHPLNRLDYHQRNHLFLYDPEMFIAKSNTQLKGKIAR